ncbi:MULTISPECIES: hypothetical protein [unclassified Acidovorax]|uniref:hypothetical protein n=1 Tax=unclassified Acidovorax TaxID=2684926 RepID=UPI0028831DE6|nr:MULTISPECIES: hypothetical protein [unclassified Acidovorax]
MLNRSTLSLLQQAGESLYAAQQAVAQDVRSHAEGVVHAVASAPFSPESDRAYAQLRTVARLAQELQALDEQLRAIYVAAASADTPTDQVLAALPLSPSAASRPRREASQPTQNPDSAQDAVVKRSSTAQQAAQQPKLARAGADLRLSKNDEKVLTYLQRSLKPDVWTALTHAAIARGAGIPLGSIGIAVKRLIHAGCVLEAERGLYRIA